MEAQEELFKLWPHIQAYQKLAAKFGINDIFLDGGGKTLHTLILLNLTALPGRYGNDAKDVSGQEYELKSVNITKSTTTICTGHHVHQDTINRYRKTQWIISLYQNIELQRIYKVSPDKLEPYFKKWEEQLVDRTHLNNPSIPVKYIETHGEIIYNKPSRLLTVLGME